LLVLYWLLAKGIPSRGASFSILLPILPAENQPHFDGPATGEAPAFGTVLLVDDEEAVLELEKEILRGRCQGVCSARIGREAIEVLERD